MQKEVGTHNFVTGQVLFSSRGPYPYVVRGIPAGLRDLWCCWCEGSVPTLPGAADVRDPGPLSLALLVSEISISLVLLLLRRVPGAVGVRDPGPFFPVPMVSGVRGPFPRDAVVAGVRDPGPRSLALLV